MYLSGRPVAGAPVVCSLLVLLNTGHDAVPVALPGPPWAASYETLLDTADERPVLGGAHDAGSTVPMGARSLRLLAARAPRRPDPRD
jgi:glycogen operon protein